VPVVLWCRRAVGDRRPGGDGDPEHEPAERFHEAEVGDLAVRQRHGAVHAEREDDDMSLSDIFALDAGI
jgi:hypothetical protein